MSDETKTPQPGEWWRAKDLTENAFICGFDEVGDPVVKRAADIYDYEMSVFLHHWHHEQRCTGFDWIEPPAIDPGEGWELLSVGTVLEDGDEFLKGETWIPTGNAKKDTVNWNTYRRKIKPAEPQDEATKALHTLAIAAGFDPLGLDPADIAEELIEKNKLRAVEELCQMCCQPAIPGTGGCRECTQYAIETTGCPVESPDDWVEINRDEYPDHVPRSGIDVLLRSENDPELAASRNASLTQSNCSKISEITWSGWKWVCRRKDLPAKQPATKRVPVRLWCRYYRNYMSGYMYVFADAAPPIGAGVKYREILHDADGFYVEVTE